jgi:hypothetical protein
MHVWSHTSIPTCDCGLILDYAYGKIYFKYRAEKSEERYKVLMNERRYIYYVSSQFTRSGDNLFLSLLRGAL